MKPIEEINSKELKAAVEAINASGVLSTKIKTVGVTKSKMVDDFVKAIDELEDDVRDGLGESATAAATFFNDLFADEVEEGGAEEEEDQCPSYGSGCDEATAECQECQTADPETFNSCREQTLNSSANEPEPEPAPAPTRGGRATRPAPAPATPAPAARTARPAPAATPAPAPAAAPPARGRGRQAAATPTAAPATVAQATAPKRGPRANIELTAHGHQVGTMSGTIDQMIEAGKSTKDKIVAKLMSEYGRDETKANNKFDGHIKWLREKKGFTVNVSKNGVYTFGS